MHLILMAAAALDSASYSYLYYATLNILVMSYNNTRSVIGGSGQPCSELGTTSSVIQEVRNYIILDSISGREVSTCSA